MNVELSSALSPIDEIIEEARRGRMFILVDDEDRENEGDLIIPAQMADAGAINFMAKHGRGLICLALTQERCRTLGLSPVQDDNQSRRSTAFTLSIEAATGVTTGISAADRARTIAVAIDCSKDREDLVTPGHVFPLVARDGGVLVRAGHTEAAVDVARLADLVPAGVICEIMNDDGSMARLRDLIPFARQHRMKIGAIADLIAYRRRTERLMRTEAEDVFTSIYGGDWRLLVYSSQVEDYAQHLALVKGDLDGNEPVLVRMHQLNLFWDLLGEDGQSKTGELQKAMQMIGEAGRGAVVIIRDTTPQAMSQRVSERQRRAEGAERLINYGVGAQILVDLGLKDIILLTNFPRKIVGLDGFDLQIREQRAIPFF
jgi:3,4-dihydroxy 2-butanone 4-phosphate synthase / GTP cyclohydrolase II